MGSLWLDRDRSLGGDPLADDGTYDDLVVGGGLTGLTTALLLARAGRKVGVLEARHVGAVTSGNTTAKVSLLQGTTLSSSVTRQSREVAAAYVDANREGMEWLLRFCEDHDIAYQRRDAVTYAATPQEVRQVRLEHEAASALGLPTQLVEHLDVPFPLHAATVLPDQAQIDPLDVIEVLVRQIRSHGGLVHEGTRVVDVSRGRPDVTLEDGTVLSAEHVVLATGIPILDRGFHFAQVEPQRSYALSFTGVPVPEGMFLSAGSNSRSVRDVPRASGDLLLVGGAGHVVGRAPSPLEHVDELRRWTEEHFPGAQETHVWSAQDYVPYLGVPIVGRMPFSDGAVFLATGFAKWGMTNGVAAAHALSSTILGSRATIPDGAFLRPGPLMELTRLNASVGVEMAAGHVRTLVGLNQRGHSSHQDGAADPLLVCTHLGGPLRWNDAECSWDCGLHGSRFAPDGSVLEGPATRPLRRSVTSSRETP